MAAEWPNEEHLANKWPTSVEILMFPCPSGAILASADVLEIYSGGQLVVFGALAVKPTSPPKPKGIFSLDAALCRRRC